MRGKVIVATFITIDDTPDVIMFDELSAADIEIFPDGSVIVNPDNESSYELEAKHRVVE